MITIAVSQHLLNEREKGKVAERQRETERESVCECRLTPEQRRSTFTDNTLKEGEREHMETHIENIFGEIKCGGLFD